MLKEIGSEFWKIDLGEQHKINVGKNTVFTLSGRTAIDFIINDIKSKRHFESIYLPSYCCHSMIEPFKRNNIKVVFYDVLVNEKGGFSTNIDLSERCDAVFLIQYFGYNDNNIEAFAKIFKERGIIVIEDATHSVFFEKSFSCYSDYVFGSFRKWTALYTGGFAYTADVDFVKENINDTNEKYYKLRKKAMKLKSTYIENDVDNKIEFLKLFNEAEEILDIDYCNYGMDMQSFENFSNIDVSYLKEKRQKNAEMILNAVKKIGFIDPVYPDITVQDIPLFVPVIIKNNLRDVFRKFLIENKIYCPVHWGLSELHEISDAAKATYQNILSLVCDQRYTEDEMKYFIGKINEFRM